MSRLRMNCLRCSSLALIFLCSCSTYKGIPRTALSDECSKLLTGTDETVLYSTKIDFNKRHFSGLLLVKTIDSSRRAVLTSEMGMKYFDFRFLGNGGFEVEHCVKPLKRRFVLNTLRADLSLLMQKGYSTIRFEQLQTDTASILLEHGSRHHTAYITASDCSRITRGEYYKRARKTAEAQYFGQPGYPADSVRITHHNLNLRLQFDKIKM